MSMHEPARQMNLSHSRESADTPRLPSLLPIRANGVVLEIDGNRLVDAIDLELSADKLTVLMGPNGAGKSLLLRLMHGLVAPSAGKITFDGLAMSDEVRRRQAMVFQRPVLLRRSVAANVDFALKIRRHASPAERDKLLDLVGLLDRAKQPARALSGGEQQRLALARALATEPDVLFLDEPTASLDPHSIELIEQIVLLAHRQGTKVIFVTHDVGQGRRLADEVVFLHLGRLVEQTPAKRFFSDPASREGKAYLEGKLVL